MRQSDGYMYNASSYEQVTVRKKVCTVVLFGMPSLCRWRRLGKELGRNFRLGLFVGGKLNGPRQQRFSHPRRGSGKETQDAFLPRELHQSFRVRGWCCLAAVAIGIVVVVFDTPACAMMRFRTTSSGVVTSCARAVAAAPAIAPSAGEMACLPRPPVSCSYATNLMTSAG